MITNTWFLPGDDISDAYFIRERVFVTEQGVPPEIEKDGSDGQAVIIVVYDGKEPVATGRFIMEGDKPLIGRVATLREQRGAGFGRLVVNMIIRKLFDAGYNRQYVHAQITAKGFYESLGFVAYGDEFKEAGITHVNMVHEGDVTGCKV